LLHISEVAEHRIKDVRDELKEGDQVLVKVLAKAERLRVLNRIRLSRKAILKEQRAKMGRGLSGVCGQGRFRIKVKVRRENSTEAKFLAEFIRTMELGST
jgi:polyribonucleotide nucleotidyltransferase